MNYNVHVFAMNNTTYMYILESTLSIVSGTCVD